MKRTVIAFAIILIAVALFASEHSKYEPMVARHSSWPSKKLIVTADSLLGKGDSDDAIVLYMMVASRNPDVADAESRIAANLHIGDIHYSKGNYADALRYYVSGLKLSEATARKPHLAVFYKNMGNVYNMFEDFEKGKSLYIQGLKIAREQKDNETAYKLLQNLIGVSIKLSDVASARQYYEHARKVPHTATEESRYMDRYTLALILNYEGKNKESLLQFRELARKAAERGINPRYECSAYAEIARIYNQAGKTDSTIYYLTRCKDVAQKNGILHQFAESVKMLYTLYEEQGNFEMAAALKNRYLEMKDSVFNQRQFDMAKNQQFLYELEKTEKVILELNDKYARSVMLISRQRIIMWCAFAAIIIGLVVSLYIYRQKKRLSESYRNLYEMHQQLSETYRTSVQNTSLAKENEDLRAELRKLTAGNDPAAEEKNEEQPLQESRRSILNSEQKERLARSILSLMEEKMPFCSDDFSLNSLASALDSNVKYVSVVINDVFRKNFSTFVNEYRINLACERLADDAGYGMYSISGIGESVGFKSNATFTTVFKKIVGITPSVYYKLAKEKKKQS